jgi:hypothetical protein
MGHILLTILIYFVIDKNYCCDFRYSRVRAVKRVLRARHGPKRRDSSSRRIEERIFAELKAGKLARLGDKMPHFEGFRERRSGLATGPSVRLRVAKGL